MAQQRYSNDPDTVSVATCSRVEDHEDICLATSTWNTNEDERNSRRAAAPPPPGGQYAGESDQDRLAGGRGRRSILARRHPGTRLAHRRAAAARARPGPRHPTASLVLDQAVSGAGPEQGDRGRSAPSTSTSIRAIAAYAAFATAGSCGRQPDDRFVLDDDRRRRAVLRAGRCCSCMGPSPTPTTCSGSSPPRSPRQALPQCGYQRRRRSTTTSVFFEHATLAVSPVINALELGRAPGRLQRDRSMSSRIAAAG